ncbi:6-phosphofructokinase 1 [archaeon BMS3Abin16]|nr:6-phosphofructokinase 1 [archaeon BMS3Abin16]GBE56785.1 6-phosphofructokinase 1 [archaeon BMS3Bbin16]
MKKLIGILTGGGDCPGLNALIRAAVRKGIDLYGFEFLGLKDGWAGLLEMRTMPLDRKAVSGILYRGGTILGSSRTNPAKSEETIEKAMENYRKLGLDALIVIGGDDTLGAANKLYRRGINAIGVPKTIDNDIMGTDMTFGFITAVQIVTDAIDRLHTTAESHHRVIVVEVMGRHAGWIATYAGIAGGAHMILVPEEPFNIEDVCSCINERKETGKNYSIIVVAEGAKPVEADTFETVNNEIDEFGNVRLGGIGNTLAKEVEKRTGFESRAVVLGHTQRGGTPTAFDRVLSTRYGIAAIDLVHQGKFGMMTGLRGTEIVPVDLKVAAEKTRTLDMELYEISKVFFG